MSTRSANAVAQRAQIDIDNAARRAAAEYMKMPMRTIDRSEVEQVLHDAKPASETLISFVDKVIVKIELYHANADRLDWFRRNFVSEKAAASPAS